MRGAKVIHYNSEVLLATEKDEGEYTYMVQGMAWLSALCWCRQEIVGAQQVEVKAGLTRSCGRADCRHPLTLVQDVGLACGPATFAVLASGLLCTEAPAAKLTPKIVPSTPNPARLTNGLDEPIHLRNKRVEGARRKTRAPRARAYRAPRRATTGKAAKRANQSRADVALRRDIVQLAGRPACA